MTLTDRIMDLSLIWKLAAEVFPHFERCSFDWDEKYREYLEKAADCEDEVAFHLLLAEFINILGDGHTDYSFPGDMVQSRGELPFTLKFAGGKYYISSIVQGGEECLFAEVLSINGGDFVDILHEAFRYIYHVGYYAYPSRLQRILPFLLNEKGNEMLTSAGTYSFDLVHDAPGMVSRAADCGIAYRSIGGGKLDIRLYEGGTVYIRLDNFLYAGAAEEVGAAIKNSAPKAVIIDLRENIGGMTMFGAGVAEKFISGEIHACQKRTRSMTGIDLACASQYAGMSDEEIAEYDDSEDVLRCLKTGRRVHFNEYTDSWGKAGNEALFKGPVSILISRDTISAAEDFVAMFKSNRRAAIIGTPTCGTTGTPLLRRLSCGGGIRICSVGYRLLDGTEFIGRGIEPDILMETDISALNRGHDAVLAYALGKLK